MKFLFKYIFGFIALFLFTFFLLPTTTNAQTAVSYRFLEVIDTEGNPVANATVKGIGSHSQNNQTDEKGTLSDFPVAYGDFNTIGIKVSKADYITTVILLGTPNRKIYDSEIENLKPNEVIYEHAEFGANSNFHDLMEVANPEKNFRIIKIKLFKKPKTKEEIKTFETEKKKSEFILAIIKSDMPTVEKLLKEGIDPNTAGRHKIPAILWAIGSFQEKLIELLLDSGVRLDDPLGKTALVYYLSQLGMYRRPADLKVVQKLISAGADVNAKSRYGYTPLSLSEIAKNEALQKMLEEAGAK